MMGPLGLGLTATANTTFSQNTSITANYDAKGNLMSFSITTSYSETTTVSNVTSHESKNVTITFTKGKDGNWENTNGNETISYDSLAEAVHTIAGIYNNPDFSNQANDSSSGSTSPGQQSAMSYGMDSVGAGTNQ